MTTQQFLGICKLPLSCLSSKDKRDTERSNLILRDFRLRGCQREWKANFISVVVSQEQFQAHFVNEGGRDFEDPITLSAASLKSNSLRVLDGCQRIHAAKQYFKGTEQWWTANIYLAETIQHPTEMHIRRAYTKTEMSGGEQYRMQREYHLGKQVRLPAGEPADFKTSIGDSKFRKLKSFYKDQDYVSAFDALLPVKGLWKGFTIGNLELLTSIKAKEEVLNYLYRIKQIWYFIGGNDDGLLQSFDAESVEFLESEGPAFSPSVRQSVSKAMKNGKLFPEIQNSLVREELSNRILSMACPIPTIHTLIQDLRFLNPLSKQMLELQKLLLISEPEAWIDSCTIKDIFIKREVEMRGENCRSTIESHYLELWLFLMRNFAALSGEKPRSGHKKTSKIMPMVCKYRWAEFVDRARTMGYILKEDAIPPLADLIAGEIRETLERARKYAPDSKISEFLNSIHDTTSHLGVENPRPSFVGNTKIKKFLRSGLPSKHACEVASKILFLHNIKVDKLVHEEGYNINEFCILHFFFINFFCPYSPFSTLNPNIPQENPHINPNDAVPMDEDNSATSDQDNTAMSDQDNTDQDNTATSDQDNTVTSDQDNIATSDRVANEPPLSEGAVNQPSPSEGAENQPPPATPSVENHPREDHKNNDEDGSDIILVLGLFEDVSGYFKTYYRLLFKVYNKERKKFFSGILKELRRGPVTSIRFVTQHSKTVPIDELAIQDRRFNDNIIFGVIMFSPEVQSIEGSKRVQQNDLTNLLLQEDDLMPSRHPHLTSFEDWIKGDCTMGEIVQSIRKRKLPFSETESRPRRTREQYTYQGSNSQHNFANPHHDLSDDDSIL